jgi:hypothetical protein
MILEKFVKQPSEVKDYDIDYTAWLTPINDEVDTTAIAIVCTSDPQDSSLVCDSIMLTPSSVKLWISGGTNGQKYKLTATTSTTGGRVDESELVFTIKEF